MEISAPTPLASSLPHVHHHQPHNGHTDQSTGRGNSASNGTGSGASKIPRFQRSQSLRLKGERPAPRVLQANRNSLTDCDHHLLDHSLLADVERSSLTEHKVALALANLRTTFQPPSTSTTTTRYVPCQRLHGPYGPCPTQQTSTHSSSTTLTSSGNRPRRPASIGLSSSTSGTLVGHRKASSPSEYGSLPSTPVPSPDADEEVLDDEDAGSVKSFRSFCSAVSYDTYHHQAALGVRGRVSGSGRKKYAVHCPSHLSEVEEYLTPTQRKDRLIRQLKAMLVRAKRELDEKDAEIERLSKEVLQLKVFNPIDQPNSCIGIDNDNNNNNSASITGDVQNARDLNRAFSSSSTQDSGLFEPSSSGESTGSATSTYDKDGITSTTFPVSGAEPRSSAADVRDSAGGLTNGYGGIGKHRQPLNELFEFSLDECLKREIEQVKRHHSNEYQELKERYNDRIENLLQKLSEANTRYFDLRPKYDYAQERIRQMEKQCQALEKQLSDEDKRHNQMYLKMYKKGQEAAKFEHADEVLEFAHHAPSRVSVPELLQQLKVTEHELHQVKSLYRREIYKQTDNMERDSEITLRFLKDAIYHFLTNKESRDHLKAIESIMGYSESERHNIEKSIFTRNKFM